MYKLSISNVVHFDVKLTVNDAGVASEFVINLEAARISIEQIRAEIQEHGELSVMDFQTKSCRENITGWKKNGLVVDDDGQPAPFSSEALDLVLSLPSAVSIIYPAYMNALVVSEGTAGRAKNS